MSVRRVLFALSIPGRIAMHVMVMILEGLFIIGVVGCAVTIPLAAWGYFSVLFEKDSAEEVGTEAANHPGARERLLGGSRDRIFAWRLVVPIHSSGRDSC